jgi:hypothetical protein
MNRPVGIFSLLLATAALTGCVVADPAPAPYAYAPGYYYAPAPAYVAPAVTVDGCFGCGRGHWR